MSLTHLSCKIYMPKYIWFLNFHSGQKQLNIFLIIYILGTMEVTEKSVYWWFINRKKLKFEEAVRVHNPSNVRIVFHLFIPLFSKYIIDLLPWTTWQLECIQCLQYSKCHFLHELYHLNLLNRLVHFYYYLCTTGERVEIQNYQETC